MIYFTLYKPIWQDSRLRTDEKLVANYFWQFTVKNNYSWANSQTIANTFGLDVDDVNDTIAKLLEGRWIKYLDCPEGTCIEFVLTKYGEEDL